MGSSDHPTPGGNGVLDPPLLAAGRRFGGRYRLEHMLGHGGMAAVWLATDERLGRPVAVKVLADVVAGDQEYLRRFRREARLAAGLQHPNLVRVFDFDAGRRPYLVLEYIEGGTLAERIEAGNPPPLERLSRELLSALRHIHAAGVLHRDVKPQNVLLDHTDHARLTDFGIAQPRGATTLTAVGKVMGTESYLAPEVMQGDPASERSDLYALGTVLADAARDGGSAPVWSLIDRLREREPQRRPASAAIALAELEQAERRSPPGEPTRPFDLEPPAPPPRLRETTPVLPPRGTEPLAAAPPSDWRRPRWLVAGALAAAAVALVVTLAFAGLGDDEPPAGPQKVEKANAGGGGSSESGTETPPPETETAVEAAPPSEPSGGSKAPADGVALNNEGKALLDAGSPEEAIPILEDALAALEGSGDELTENYARFNLADALMQVGRFDEAIPLLEERLEYPDQQDVVAAALAEAREAAGLGSGPPERPATDEGEPGPPVGGVDGPPFGNANGHDKDD